MKGSGNALPGEKSGLGRVFGLAGVANSFFVEIGVGGASRAAARMGIGFSKTGAGSVTIANDSTGRGTARGAAVGGATVDGFGCVGTTGAATGVTGMDVAVRLGCLMSGSDAERVKVKSDFEAVRLGLTLFS